MNIRVWSLTLEVHDTDHTLHILMMIPIMHQYDTAHTIDVYQENTGKD